MVRTRPSDIENSYLVSCVKFNVKELLTVEQLSGQPDGRTA